MSVYKVQMHGKLGGALDWTTAYHINSTEALSSVASALNGATTTFWTTATNGFEHLVTSAVTLVDTRVYLLNPQMRTLQKFITPNSQAGTNAAGQLPFQMSPYISFFGANDTKSDRGHMKFPAPAADQYSGNELTNAFEDSMKAILDPFFTTMKALAGYSAFSYNPRTNKQGDAPFTQHLLTGYFLGNKCGTQRNRTRKQLSTRDVTGSL